MPVILEIKMSLVNIKKIFGSFNICIIYLHVIETCLNVTIVMFYFYHSKILQILWKMFLIPSLHILERTHSLLKNIPANIRLDEDVLKTSWRRLLSSSSEDVFKTYSKCFDQDEYIRLIHTSYFTNRSSRRLEDVLQRCLQDVFKTYYQVKLFLVTQLQDFFETYSKPFRAVLLRRLSTGGLPRSHFWEVYDQYTKFPRGINDSQVLVFHFTTPFSRCLQRRI